MKIIDKVKIHLRGEVNLDHLIESGLMVGKSFSYGRYFDWRQCDIFYSCACSGT